LGINGQRETGAYFTSSRFAQQEVFENIFPFARREGSTASAASDLAVFGAALIYGDGAITPAISALEGLDIVTSTFRPYILPAAIVILVTLFAIQPLGTGRIGRTFGPIHGVVS
jgi:K+ transporter